MIQLATASRPSWWSAAIRARCPACGKGALFRGLLKVEDLCPVCGLDLRAQDSGDGPVAFIVLIVGFLVIFPILVVEANGGWPLWLHGIVWPPTILILCIGLMRPFKAGLIALQYAHRRADFETDRDGAGSA